MLYFLDLAMYRRLVTMSVTWGFSISEHSVHVYVGLDGKSKIGPGGVIEWEVSM